MVVCHAAGMPRLSRRDWVTADAEDAAQEIIIRVITNLRTYRFEGSFRAWVLRIAVNKLKTVRKTFTEKRMASWERPIPNTAPRILSQREVPTPGW